MSVAHARSSLPPPPPRALDDAGRPRYGAYAGVLAGADLKEAHAEGLGPRVGAAPRGGILGRAFLAARRLRHKRWLYVGVFGERAFVGAAVLDLGYLGGAFAYAGDRASGELAETSWMLPGGPGVDVAAAFDSGVSAARLGERRVSFAALPGREANGAGPASFVGEVRSAEVDADLEIDGLGTALSVLTDLGGGLPATTIKAVGARVRGKVRLRGRAIPLDGATYAAIDWTHGFFPYRTVWRWATAAGRDAAGRLVGVNLCRGVHEDPHGRFSENALWLDGRPAALPRIAVDVPDDPTAPWTIRSAPGGAGAGGLVDLRFRPLGERRGDVNFGVIHSAFRQPFGTFEGTVRDLDGRESRLEGTGGVVEDHTAKW